MPRLPDLSLGMIPPKMKIYRFETKWLELKVKQGIERKLSNNSLECKVEISKANAMVKQNKPKP